MKELLLNIITKTQAKVRADILLKHALEKVILNGNYYLLAIGKAACIMAEAAKEFLTGKPVSALVITPLHHEKEIPGMQVITAAHPYPDASSLAAGNKVYDFVKKLKHGDKLVLLISGGASALAELPLPGVSLAQISNLTRQLQIAGADIIELNTVRKHLSQLKGGRLAKLAEAAEITAFLLSDVPADRLDTIGSGMAAADMTTSRAALEILHQYQIEITPDLQTALLQETPKEISNVKNYLIGNNELLCQMAAESILSEGYIPWLVTTSLNGEARDFSRIIPDIVRKARSPESSLALPCIAICGGEAIVTVQGSGKGGRNLEMALAAAIYIRELPGVTVAAFASDGADGNSGFAGAIVDHSSYAKMLAQNIIAENYLLNNDSAAALAAIDAVFNLPAAETNLNDLLLILIDK